MSPEYSDAPPARNVGLARRLDIVRAAKDRLRLLVGPYGTALARRSRWSLMCRWHGRGRIPKPMDPRWLDVLEDAAFAASMREVRDISSLDTARLANLWQWCRSSEEGAIIEVGAFRGGTSLHLSNCWPRRKVFVCDTFAGFAPLALHPQFDRGIERSSWFNPDAAAVAGLFADRGRDAVILEGIFPDSAKSAVVRDVSFAHIDVDVYESCRRSLEYLAQRATPAALLVVNDFLRQQTTGVQHAVVDFLAAHPDWIAIPVFPGQGVLLNRATYQTDRSALGR